MDRTESFGGFQQTTSTSLPRVVDKITITTARQFNFPSAMYKKNRLSRYKAARLFYNKKSRQIGIEFIPAMEEGAFKLVPSGENGRYGAYIVAKSFFFLNELKSPRKAERYDYKKAGLKSLGAKRTGTMYLIDLSKKEALMVKQLDK